MDQQLTYEQINFSDIKINAHGFKNCRSPEFQTGNNELEHSIKNNGLCQPMVMWKVPVEDGFDYVLMQGWRRWCAITNIREQLPDFLDKPFVGIFEGSLEDAKSKNLEENIHKESLDEADEAESVYDLYLISKNETRIASKLGMSQSWVSQRVSLVRGSIRENLGALRQGLINVTQAIGISKLTLDDGKPNRPVQLTALDAIINPRPKETTDVDSDAEEKKKKYRTKKDVQGLESDLAEYKTSGDCPDVAYLELYQRMLDWMFCRIETEELLVGPAADDTDEVTEEPMLDAEEN